MTGPIRVLVIESAGNLWGSERALLDLIDALPDAQVAVCCPPRMPLERELTRRGLRVYPYFIYGLHQKSRWQRLRAALGVVATCVRFRPDVVYLNQAGSYRVALVAATLLRLPIIGHVRIFEDAEYLGRQRGVASHVRGLIAISRAIEEEIGRFPALSAIPVHRIYDAYAASAAGGTPGDAPPRLACVGRLVPMKGQDVLLDALGVLASESEPVDCLMLGSGAPDYEAELRARAERNGAGRAIRWLGFVDQVLPALAGCAVLVCPSHREPLGRVIFEAWDAGLVPVVYAGSGGAAEVVLASGGGLVYGKQEGGALAAVLRKAIRLDSAEREALVVKGRRWLAENCEPRRYGLAIATILKRTAP